MSSRLPSPRLARWLVATLALLAGPLAAWPTAGAQTGTVAPAERQACLDGYLAFCDADRMAPADVAAGRARHAENNRRACAAAARGAPDYSCDRRLLSQGEAAATAAVAADVTHGRALTACLAGASADDGCDEAVLTAAERRDVLSVDLARNLTRCLTGRTSDALLCVPSRLTSAERRSVEAAARGRRAAESLASDIAPAPGAAIPAAASVAGTGTGTGGGAGTAAGSGTLVGAGVPPASGTPETPVAAGCAENGSCYGDVSAATGRPKTVFVDGYTRKDGTYVRGHVRSAPRKH